MQTELHFYTYKEKIKPPVHLPYDHDHCLPFASARGCTQTLEPEGHMLVHRTLSGDISIWEGSGVQKYRSHITCSDTFCPGVEGLGPGMKVWVECLVRLTTPRLHGGIPYVLPRIPVKKSLKFHGQEGEIIPLSERYFDEESNLIHIQEEVSCHVSYRPLLAMVIDKFMVKTTEWEGATTWEMDLWEL